MSYILEALKKSEKERQRGKSPDLLTVQDTIPQEIKKRPVLNYLIVTALLLNALFLVFWLKPNQSKNTAAVSMPAEEPKPAVKGEDTAPQAAKDTDKEVRVETHITPSTERGAVEKAPGADSNAVKKKPVQEKFDLVPSLAPKQSAVVARVPSETKPVKESAPFAENRIYNRSELPSSVQQALPDFNITVSIYSENPAARMIKINGEILHEGEALSQGLKLEAINPDGAVLSYQNYHFRVGLR